MVRNPVAILADPDFSHGGGTGGSLRPRKVGLGLRAHRGGAGQPKSSYFGPDCGQYSTPQQRRTRSEAESNDDLEGIHPPAHGRARRHRFLHVEVLTWRGLVTYYVLFF